MITENTIMFLCMHGYNGCKISKKYINLVFFKILGPVSSYLRSKAANKSVVLSQSKGVPNGLTLCGKFNIWFPWSTIVCTDLCEARRPDEPLVYLVLLGADFTGLLGSCSLDRLEASLFIRWIRTGWLSIWDLLYRG